MKIWPQTLSQLPFLRKQEAVLEFSSYNRQGINLDHGNYLYKDKHGDPVIFDASGPGCLCSFWITGLLGEVILKFYFDDSEQALYEINILDFFQGKHKDFPTPLVSYERRGYHLGEDSMAGNCFVPINFQKRLKISIQGNEDFFYHFFWKKFPAADDLSSFPDQESLVQIEKFFTAPDEVRKADWQNSKVESIQLEVLPKKAKTDIWQSQDPADLCEICIEAPLVPGLLDQVLLCASWDKQPYLQVQAPLGNFFAIPLGGENVDSLPLRTELLADNRIRMISYWPMPYWKSAHIYLENRSDFTIPDLKISFRTRPNNYPQNDCGYFTALYRQGETEHGNDWQLFASPGWGHFIGVIQTMDGEHYCEGDEHFYIDGACSPQINGTGSEDYYLGCFWPNTKYDSAFAGCVYDIYKKAGGLKENFYRLPAAYYRFHLEAPIPFYSHLDARIQHGAYSNIKSSYSSLAFCYLKKTITLQKSDHLIMGSKSSLSLHEYRATGHGQTIMTESACEGNYADIISQEQGILYSADLSISFQLAICPDNQGVKIRRRLDQKYGPQRVAVYVDDVRAGIWQDPNVNPYLRWYDSDFELPAELTKEKDCLEIRLEFSPDQIWQHFTAFSFSAFSYRFPTD